ncbi:MAG TPA: VOC family protein, partial [Rariglobus sp.]
FHSYFLSFGEGARLEIMQKPGVEEAGRGPACGLAHFAVSVGSEERVRSMTENLRVQGVRVSGEPRRTGDGYFESVVLDPDGNLIEITL